MIERRRFERRRPSRYDDEYGYLKNVKASMLAQDVIAEAVLSLEQVPIEAILKFRERKNHEIENFRVEMRKLITEIESNPWDSDFPNYVSNIVDSKVKPALKEVENEVRGCRDAFWADAIKTFAKVSPLPIIGTIFAGCWTAYWAHSWIGEIYEKGKYGMLFNALTSANTMFVGS